MLPRFSLIVTFALLAGCQAVPVTNNEASTVDPATYAPRRPASSVEDLNANIKFTQDFKFQERQVFPNFLGKGSCTLYQTGRTGDGHQISSSEVYSLGFRDGAFYLGSRSARDNLNAMIFCEDVHRRRLEFRRDFNLRDLLRAMGAILTK